MKPWEGIARKLGALAELAAAVKRIDSNVRANALAIASVAGRLAVPAPAPYVVVIVEGWRETPRPSSAKKTRISCGTAGEVFHGGATLRVDPQVALTRVRIAVFADLRAVEIDAIFLGTNLLHAVPDNCPVAYAPRVLPGERITVQLRRRV